MGRRKNLLPEKKHITSDVLLGLLETGAVLGVALIAPNALRILKPLIAQKEKWDTYYPSSIARNTMKLWRKGLVNVVETPDGYVVTISDSGKTEALRYNLDTMEISKPPSWDGKWRMVFFDLPIGTKTRDNFRRKLLSLGLFQMQKSVYVYPYPCSNEIRFLREVFAIPHGVKMAVVEQLENDEDLRRVFKLE